MDASDGEAVVERIAAMIALELERRQLSGAEVLWDVEVGREAVRRAIFGLLVERSAEVSAESTDEVRREPVPPQVGLWLDVD